MTPETIADIRRNPSQLYGYKSGMFSQRPFAGNLAGPEVAGGGNYDPASGAVPPGYSNGAATVNPEGFVGVPFGDTLAPAGATAPNRWFSNPWKTQAKDDVPWYMKGFNYG